MTNQSGTSSMLTKFFLPILWIFGLIIFGISIAGIVESQYVFAVHLFVVVLVFVIFMGILSGLQMFLQKKSESNYNVEAGNEVETNNAGKENKAYDTLDKTASAKEAAAAKWVNNYVPYGDYPKGNDVARQESANTNGTTVHVSDGDEIDFKEAKCDDEPEDSNKQE